MHQGITSDEDGAVGAAAAPSKILKFRGGSAATSAPAAGDDDPLSSSPAISLGSAVQAVVLRLANKRIRVRVMRTVPREEDKDRPL